MSKLQEQITENSSHVLNYDALLSFYLFFFNQNNEHILKIILA